jgi:drug/metabolite transporter (DMT)-like permease
LGESVNASRVCHHVADRLERMSRLSTTPLAPVPGSMTPRHVAMLLMIAVMCLWGSTFVVTKATIVEIPPLTLAFLRVGVGALVLLPFALIRRHRVAHSPQLPWKSILQLSCIGVAFYYFTFNLGMSRTSASQGALVQSCIPAMTALVAVVLLREKASRTRLMGIALSIVGVLVIFSGAAGGAAGASVSGNLLVFLSVIAWGVYTSIAKRITEHDCIVVTVCVLGCGALLLLPAALFELSGPRFPTLSLHGCLAVVYLGALASGIAFLVYNHALRYMEAGQAGVFANLIPVVGVLSGIVVLHEPLSLQSIAGGIVVTIGVWITGAEKSAEPARA